MPAASEMLSGRLKDGWMDGWMDGWIDVPATKLESS